MKKNNLFCCNIKEFIRGYLCRQGEALRLPPGEARKVSSKYRNMKTEKTIIAYNGISYEISTFATNREVAYIVARNEAGEILRDFDHSADHINGPDLERGLNYRDLQGPELRSTPPRHLAMQAVNRSREGMEARLANLRRNHVRLATGPAKNNMAREIAALERSLA